jgi:hypothetical protein
MYTGQLNWAAPSNLIDGQGKLNGAGKVAEGGDSPASFALMYEAIMALSDEQGPDEGASGSLLDSAGEGGQAASFDSIQESFGALNFKSSMGQALMSRGTLQVGGAQSPGTRELFPHSAMSLAGQATPAIQSTTGGLNKNQLSEWMDAHALSRSSHHCAMYCRMGMEAAGMNTDDRPQSGDAGDYGPFLMRHGAQTVDPNSYVPQVGDVVVFDKTDQHPYGHIEMYDGHQWVSDFMQHGFSPYRDAESTPPYTIYRLA